MLVLSVLVVGPVGAVNVVQEDGVEITAEAASPLQLTKATEGNITVQFTEDQSVPNGGSITFLTNVTASSATVATGNTTAVTASVNDDNVTISDDTADGWAESVTAVNITFTYSESPGTNGSLADGIDTSSALTTEQDLAQDPDDSENVSYVVVDTYIDTTYDVTGDAGGEINATSGDFEPNSTGPVTLSFDLSRNESDYENYTVDTLKYEVAVNTTYFADISEATSEDVDEIVLEDVKTENGEKVFVWAIQSPDNTTTEHWDDITVKVDATVLSGEANATLTHTETHDPSTGGPEASYATEFGHAAGAGIVAPNFFQNPAVTAVGIVVGILVLVGILWMLRRDRDASMGLNGYAAYSSGWMMWAWVIALLAGATMVYDWASSMVGMLPTFNFWTNLLVGSGLPEVTTIIAGIAVVVIALGVNAQNSMG